MEELVPFGGRAYWGLFALLAVGRGLDFLSTWVATPNLVLEANPIARKLGWKWSGVVNLALCVGMALWPLPALIVVTTSVLVAARNFKSAWLMRSLGEHEYRAWMTARVEATPWPLFLFCMAGETLPFVAVGGALMYFESERLIPLAVGMGNVAYGLAVAFYTLLSVWRLRRFMG
ncbi:hypothetical protein LBMAG56_15920 [Verrucomicrobiota bacterium]|nr:hypothetical protein LBMAG56_15920 [Verrucomicrobiota bacterium]